jgi:ABC-type multidrug transport system fused ATPase/permease subunit
MTALVLVCGSGMALARRNRIGEARMTGTRHSNASGRLYDAISEHLGSLKLAKGYGVVGRHADLFERLSRDVSDVTLANVRSFARLRQELAIGSAAVLAAIVYVSYQVLAISTAQLLLLLFLFARLVPRLTTVYEKVQALAAALPAFAAVSETERQCLAAAEPRVDRAQPIDLTRAIHLDRVTFAYDDTERAPELQPPHRRLLDEHDRREHDHRYHVHQPEHHEQRHQRPAATETERAVVQADPEVAGASAVRGVFEREAER